MTWRSCLLGLTSLTIALAFAPQAVAGAEPEAKFKVQSVSGRESLSFREDGETSTGERCVGSTTSEVSWRSTRPTTVYVFFKRVHGDMSTVLSADRDVGKYEFVPIVGEATISRSVSYSETAGCDEQPTACPETTGPAKPFLTGTDEPDGSVNAGIDRVDLPPGVDAGCEKSLGIAAGIVDPYGNAAGFALPSLSVSAFAMPRKQLFDPKRKRLEASASVEESLEGSYDAADQATVSGTYTDHLAIKLKRLKLKR